MVERENDMMVSWEEQMAMQRANRPHLAEAMALVAETYTAYAGQYRQYFEALTSQGFTPEQALEIVKTHGATPK